MNERIRTIIISALQEPAYNREGRTNRNLPRELFNHDIQVSGRFGINTNTLVPFYSINIQHERPIFNPERNYLLSQLNMKALNERELEIRVPILGHATRNLLLENPENYSRYNLEAQIIQAAVGGNTSAYYISNLERRHAARYIRGLHADRLDPRTVYSPLQRLGLFARRLGQFAILFRLSSMPGRANVSGVNTLFKIAPDYSIQFKEDGQFGVTPNEIIYPTFPWDSEPTPTGLTPSEHLSLSTAGNQISNINIYNVDRIPNLFEGQVAFADDDGTQVPLLRDIINMTGATRDVRNTIENAVQDEMLLIPNTTLLGVVSLTNVQDTIDILRDSGFELDDYIAVLSAANDSLAEIEEGTVNINTPDENPIERQVLENIRRNNQEQNQEIISPLGEVSQLLEEIGNETVESVENLTDIIKEINQRAYDNLEKARPTGGGQTEHSNKIVTSRKGINALQKLVQNHDLIGQNEIIKRGLQFSNFRGAEALIETDLESLNETQRRQSKAIGGYWKGKLIKDNFYKIAMDTAQSGMDTHLWNSRITRENITKRILDNNPGLINNIRNFSIGRDDIEVVNVPDANVRELQNSGLIIPVEDNKVIFVPGFADITHTFGLEFELKTPPDIPRSGTEAARRKILQHLKENYGIDLKSLTLDGTGIEVDDDASVHFGHEVVTGVLTGVTGIKALYYLGKTLQDLGYSAGMNRRGDIYGLHVNVGQIPEEFRKDATKFAVDYLRLTEDFYKRGFVSGARYNSRYYNMLEFLTEGIPRNDEQVWKHFWFSGISKFRKLSGGENEYKYLRQHGTYPSSYNLRRIETTSSYIKEKVAKYKPMSFHKMILYGIGEFRIFDGSVKPEMFLNQLFLGLKMFNDIYNGARNRVKLPETDRLIPPEEGWTNEEAFKETTKMVMGINDNVLLDYLWQFHNKCRNTTNINQM